MKTYYLSDIHKIEVIEKAPNRFGVRFYEKVVGCNGIRWIEWGTEETWISMDDIKYNYGIEEDE